MSATHDEATADEIAAIACEQARHYADRGDLPAAGDAFQRALDLGETSSRAQAALGLAAVREGLGDLDGALVADRLAVDSGDPEYGPRAAYHLAVTCERMGMRDEAAASWRRVVDFGNEAYLPAGLVALARREDEDGDFDAARALWERAARGGDPHYGPAAALELGTRLVERGDPSAARELLEQALSRGAEVAAVGRLWTGVGVAHLEQAVAAFREGARSSDADTLPLALELLARTLPLRGRYGEASEVWQDGLNHDDPQVAAAVRARLRREFSAADGGGDGGADAGEPWWEEFVETAVSRCGLPALAAEAFSALDLMYALVAAHHDRDEGVPEDLYEDLCEAVRVPGHFAWGDRLHASVRERLLRLREGGAEDGDGGSRTPGPPDAG